MTEPLYEEPGERGVFRRWLAGAGGAFRRWIDDNLVSLILYGIAFGGSFDHWMHLADKNGQTGFESLIAGVCVDLGVYNMTKERARDAREGRQRKGWFSMPTLFLVGLVALTLAGNVASATHTAWGVIISLIPGAVLLMTIALMERRAAEATRRAKARQAEAEAEAGKQERQRQLDLQRLDRQQRHAHITGGPDPGVSGPSAPGVNGPSMTVSPGPMAPAAPNATEVMRAFWDREVSAGRIPSGADLLRAAGLPSTSSLGRQNAAKWRAELEQASRPADLRPVGS